MPDLLMEKLETAFKEIEKISDSERPVKINGQEIILGVVDGKSEEAIQSFLSSRPDAEAAAKGEGEVKVPALLRDIKVETLVYAFKALNGERLDKIDFFIVKNPSGGEDLKIERQIFLRNKLKSWPPFLVTYLFNQYVTLVNEASANMEPAFKIEGLDELVKDELQSDQDLMSKIDQEMQEDSIEESKESETTEPREVSFRKLEDEPGGVLDQTGY